ncbi:MAG TPA: DpnI domain-containing protein, partial [Candidatus Saccharimonadales bacterium]|nr:DpnI domain-containing protein [Candidatus Saccharimonadales bacterium]
NCYEWFQLKSQKRSIGTSLPDGAYAKMAEAIELDRTPNLFALHYNDDTWRVRNLLLVPRFTYTLSAIKRREPLRSGAERHGWVGCSILLSEIPPEARIRIVVDGDVRPASEVRSEYRKLHKLSGQNVEARGWTLDVLKIVHALGKKGFSLQEIYEFEPDLSRLHPANQNVQPKIRQQLQELRKMGLLEFLGRGKYRLR